MNWTRRSVVSLVACLCLCVAAGAVAQEALDESGEAAMGRAKRLYQSGDFRGALEELSRVLAVEPDRADALYLSGYSHLMLREYPESVSDFSRAFAADPTFDPRTIYQPTRVSE